MSLIYNYFEPGVLLPEKTKTGKDIYEYVCKLCKADGKTKNGKTKNGKSLAFRCDERNENFIFNFYICLIYFFLKAGMTNLIELLRRECHHKEYEEYQAKYQQLELEKAAAHTPRCAKKLRFDQNIGSPQRLNLLSSPN